VKGRPTTDPPRKRRWNHQLWQDGPKDVKVPPAAGPRQFIAANLPNGRDASTRAASNEAVDTCSRDVVRLGRGKMFDTRGLCMTPGVRANGPSYMKPLPPLARRPDEATTREGDEPPIVIIRTVANRQEIVFVSRSASTFGIRPGMTLTEARALCSKVVAFDHDPLRDARALEALGRWMVRFTPFVSLPLPQGETEPDEDGHCLYLDITGCARVFGGISNIVGGVIDALRRMRVDAGVAVAPTPGAAWALASFGECGRIVTPDDVAAALAPLPVAGLRLTEKLRESLHHLGIEAIGQLAALPRSSLPARFGPTLLMRLDQAFGRATEPLVPLPWHTPITSRMDFEGPIDSWETVWLVFKQLIERVLADLTRRGCGARRVEVEFHRADRKIVRHAIALSRPSRDGKNLFNLIRCATENVDGGDDGFLSIRLHVPVAERLDPEQIALLGGERYAAEIEFAQLAERLSVRLGEGALARPMLVESHIPERAFSFTWHGPPAREGTTDSSRAGSPCHERPLQLLPHPLEVHAMVTPSEDRDGRPVQFQLGRELHRLRHAVGPERISGEWWRGHDRTRDYFDVEDEQGRRFWVFRVNETNRWYVHGSFG
jgi:protein ImuB